MAVASTARPVDFGAADGIPVTPDLPRGFAGGRGGRAPAGPGPDLPAPAHARGRRRPAQRAARPSRCSACCAAPRRAWRCPLEWRVAAAQDPAQADGRDPPQPRARRPRDAGRGGGVGHGAARRVGPDPAPRPRAGRASSPTSSPDGSRSSARASSTTSTRCRPRCAASASRRSAPCPIAAFVVTKGQQPPDDIVRECRRREIPLFVSDRTTSVVIQSITRVLEDELAPSTTLHGVLVDVYGMGVLLLGESGIGKSECALDLVQRGHRLVADDVGRDPPLSERGARRPRRRDDPLPHGAARHRHHQHQAPLRRLGRPGLEVGRARDRARSAGIRPRSTTASGSTARRTRSSDRDMPLLRLPVASGRNLALLIEIAARNELLKSQGYDAAKEFARRVDEEIAKNSRPRKAGGQVNRLDARARDHAREPRRRDRPLGLRQELRQQVPRGHGVLLRRQPAARAARAAARPGDGARGSASSSTCATRTSPCAFPRSSARLRARVPGHAPALPRRLGGVADPPLLGDAPSASAGRQGPAARGAAPRARDARERPRGGGRRRRHVGHDRARAAVVHAEDVRRRSRERRDGRLRDVLRLQVRDARTTWTCSSTCAFWPTPTSSPS